LIRIKGRNPAFDENAHLTRYRAGTLFTLGNQAMTQRREFILHVALGSTALLASQVQAATPMLAETDPQAGALGYKADATKVDKTKFPKYAAGQLCNNCALYQGKAADAAAGCPLFAGKQVAGKGWCSAYAKKA
jgi:hypothetical protein